MPLKNGTGTTSTALPVLLGSPKNIRKHRELEALVYPRKRNRMFLEAKQNDEALAPSLVLASEATSNSVGLSWHPGEAGSGGVAVCFFLVLWFVWVRKKESSFF